MKHEIDRDIFDSVTSSKHRDADIQFVVCPKCRVVLILVGELTTRPFLDAAVWYLVDRQRSLIRGRDWVCLVCGASWLPKRWHIGKGFRSFIQKVNYRVKQTLRREYVQTTLIEASFDDVKVSPWRDFFWLEGD
jgi:hypothetical protein